MAGGSFRIPETERALSSARASMRDASDNSADFFRESPSRAAYAGDGGLLDDFDAESASGKAFNDHDLDDDDLKRIQRRLHEPVPLESMPRRDSDYRTAHLGYSDKNLAIRSAHHRPVRTDSEGREEEYRTLMAAHQKVREKTSYVHAGESIDDELGNNWQKRRLAKIDPEGRLPENERSPSMVEAWWEADWGGMKKTPEEGWDKPKVGKFRSAMSWLGNKLTFGKFGGRDYRDRHEALTRRRNLVTRGFRNQMAYFDEREYDQANPNAYGHERFADQFGAETYIGRRVDPFNKATMGSNNPRYNNTWDWIKNSKYGRKQWGKLFDQTVNNSSLKFENPLKAPNIK